MAPHGWEEAWQAGLSPCLELTSDGMCDGCDPGEKCSSLYVMRGVRGWTAWDGCTTGTLFDCKVTTRSIVNVDAQCLPLPEKKPHASSNWTSAQPRSHLQTGTRAVTSVCTQIFQPSTLNAPQVRDYPTRRPPVMNLRPWRCSLSTVLPRRESPYTHLHALPGYLLTLGQQRVTGAKISNVH